MADSSLIALARLSRRQVAVVAGVEPDGEQAPGFSARLRELGFIDGEEVEILAISAAGGPLAVRVGESTFALRRGEAERITVRVSPRWFRSRREQHERR